MNPSIMAMRGRVGAYVKHSRHDPRESTALARAAFLSKFLDEVDPDRTLPEPERLRRAEMARRAYFSRLALRSAQTRARKGRAAGRGGA